MASIENKVLTEILNSNNLAAAIKAGLKNEFFKDPECRSIYRFIEHHYHSIETRYELPLEEDIQARWPSFTKAELKPSEVGGVKSLVNKLRSDALGSDIISKLSLWQTYVEDGNETPQEILRKYLMPEIDELSYRYSETSRPFGISEIIQHVRDTYDDIQSGVAYGIPWPWECLTKDTLGKKPEDFVVFYGRMKSLKSWLLLYCAVMDYVQHNQRVMFWSKEMGEKQLKLRIGSILAGVDYQLLKRGKLPPPMKKRAFAALRDLEGILSSDHSSKGKAGRKRRDLFILSGREAPKTVQELQGMVKSFEVDILYVDSFYHLTSIRADKARQDWQRIMYLAEDLKNLALDYRIPVIAAAQANRLGEKLQGENLTEVAGSDAIGREADLMIRVVKGALEETQQEEKEVSSRTKFTVKGPETTSIVVPQSMKAAKLGIVLPGNREGVLEAFTLLAQPGYNFSVIDDNVKTAEIQAWFRKESEDAKKDAEEKVRRKRVKPEEQSVKGSFGTGRPPT